MDVRRVKLHRFHAVVALLAFLVTLLFFALPEAGHEEPRLIIIGDSLSTTHECWPNYLREMAPRWNIQVMAQNGRTIRDFSIPRDLWTIGNENETVIYFLGTNDILQRNHIAFAASRLKADIRFLLDQQFKVLLIIPPTPDFDKAIWGKSIKEHRELVKSFRGTDPNLWVYDMDNIWDKSETPDGIHPSAELSWKIAEAINWVLAQNIY